MFAYRFFIHFVASLVIIYISDAEIAYAPILSLNNTTVFLNEPVNGCFGSVNVIDSKYLIIAPAQ